VRIGIDAHYLGNNKTGNETYTLNLLRALSRVDKGDNDYSVYLTKPEVAAQQVVVDSRFKNRLLRPSAAVLRIPIVLPCELARRPVDLLHSQYFIPPFVSCKSVVTIHDVSFEDRAEHFRPLNRFGLRSLVPRSIRRAEKVLAVSQWLKDTIVKLYDIAPEKIVVTHLAASQNFYRRDVESARAFVAANFGITTPFLLYVGNIVPGKNVEGIVKAFACFRRNSTMRLPKLVIVGPKLWGWGAVSSLVEEFKLRDEVVCTGYVSQESLPQFYTACDVFLFPSFSETFGLPVLEAMSCGAPVVASIRGALPEVTDGAALLVNPEDPTEIAEAIYHVLSSSGCGADLQRRGIERSRAFSWNATAAKTLTVYNEIM
jgi:glycosyltransferase involved in cell wall biosynthesis